MQSQPSDLPQGCGFLSQAPDSQTFIPEDFDSESRLMIETAEEFSRKEVLPAVERLEHQEEGLMPGLIKQAGELGLCGIDCPEAYGGLGLDKNLAARMLEFLSLNASFSVTIGITSGISQVGLSLFGNEKQKSQYLPDLASGKEIGAYALSEPDSGSDALSLTTKAEKRGDKYILNGTKMWISNAKWADLFLVMAKVDGTQLSAFLVERDFPGVTVARDEHKMGLKGSSTARLVLENAEVPADNLLYEEGLGHHVAFNALNLGRFKLASMSLGPARDALSLAAAYVNERKQFGQKVGNFGLIQQKFALMASLFFASESMTYRTGNLIDRKFENEDGTLSGNRRAAEEYAVECSIGKVFATEAEAIIVDEALQCFGGYGFVEEFPIARHYRDARISRIYEGTNEINRLFSADRVRKKIAAGLIPAELSNGSFPSELAEKLLQKSAGNQVVEGALADLIMLTYASQSSSYRASKRGDVSVELDNYFQQWANGRAASIYHLATGEAVSLPSSPIASTERIAEEVYGRNAPL